MFESEFENLLSKYTDALKDRGRFTGLVKDYFQENQMQCNLVIAAYNLGIAAEIEGAGIMNNAFAFRFVKRLVDEYGVSRANADWVISLWCVCYGKKVLHKPCEITVSSGKTGSKPAIQDESHSVKQYGDLFQYSKSSDGLGLAVSGFTGENNRTIIFQNMSRNQKVLEIQSEAFSESMLQEAIMSEGILRVGEKAFMGCTQLHQIILPVSLRELGNYCLAGCAALQSITLPEQLEQIGAGAFASSGLKAVKIPKSVYYMGESVFSGCTALTNVDLQQNINEIPARMFRGCTNLKKIRLHENITEIGDEAFADCESMAEIYVPDSVKKIGIDAFIGTDKKFILQCTFGSYAESYARSNKINYQLV